MPNTIYPRPPRKRPTFAHWLAPFLVGWTCALACSIGLAQKAMAPVEVRNPWPPEIVMGSDGHAHLAYELHVSNFYGDTGVLRLRQLTVFADDSTTPLATFDGAALGDMVSPHLAEGAKAGDNLAIKAGARAIVFVWLTLSDRRSPARLLRHRLEFENAQGGTELVDGARVAVDATPAVVIGPPLRGLWLATEGPGNSNSHHWGSLVAVNGQLTIPQRYALDLIGVDVRGHALHAGVADYRQSQLTDWIGFGTDVLAVADGIVLGARDGEADHKPLAPQPEPSSLTANGLYGNYVVLQIAPNRFVHYAHLQRGSVTVKPGDKVHRGDVLGHVGQSGMSGGPHLHFQVSNAPTFEGSEGVPFVFDTFSSPGAWSVSQAIDPDAKLPPTDAASDRRRQAMPLDNDLVGFPAATPSTPKS
ncbi:hypothetical protein B0E50_10010 [Rhodanobacter sp. C01]|nr:hypothetical protein B0E50_10010 [Rhodanobacter sp. C01]